MAKEKTDKKTETDEQVVDLNNDRLDDIEMLAEQMEKDREKEMSGETDIEEDDTEEETEKEEETEEEEGESEETSDEEEAEETTDDDEFETLVIDGKEQKVSKADIYEIGKRAKQKELAVDETLERVKKLERDLEAQKAATQTFKPPPQEQPKPFETELKDAEKVLDDSRRVYAKAQSDLDEDAIYEASISVSEAEENVAGIKKAQAQESYRQQRMTKIREKFTISPEEGGLSDVWDDDYARAIAASHADKMIKEGADPFAFDVYEQSAKFAREKLGWVKEETPGEEAKTQETDALEQKKAKKKEATKQTIKPNNQKTKSTKESDKPKTREQIKQDAYAEIAKTREHLAIT